MSTPFKLHYNATQFERRMVYNESTMEKAEQPDKLDFQMAIRMPSSFMEKVKTVARAERRSVSAQFFIFAKTGYELYEAEQKRKPRT